MNRILVTGATGFLGRAVVTADILAGQTAGCACTIRVDHGLVEEQLSAPDRVVRSLSEAADFILRRDASHKAKYSA